MNRLERGFTLIELSIVLVIIGLIVGGVLVGQELIRQAAVRATVTQVEKFNQAVNTFQGKYGYLPGDMPDPPAGGLGFVTPRANVEGEGNGNGLIEGNGFPTFEEIGENTVFWVDLSTAGLIDGAFSSARELSGPASVSGSTTPNLNAFFPQAKLGNGNYFYVWDGSPTNTPTGSNYYGLSAISTAYPGWVPMSTPGLTVLQAYSIDRKVDDGFPQSGNVVALYLNYNVNDNSGAWAAGGGVSGAATPEFNSYTSGNGPTTAATPGSPTTCYDNGNSNGTMQQYSVEVGNGSNVNCALSFKFQ